MDSLFHTYINTEKPECENQTVIIRVTSHKTEISLRLDIAGFRVQSAKQNRTSAYLPLDYLILKLVPSPCRLIFWSPKTGFSDVVFKACNVHAVTGIIRYIYLKLSLCLMI